MSTMSTEEICERCMVLKGLDYTAGTFTIAAIANALADGLSIDEIRAFGRFIQAIGLMMTYIEGQRQLNASCVLNPPTLG